MIQPGITRKNTMGVSASQQFRPAEAADLERTSDHTGTLRLGGRFGLSARLFLLTVAFVVLVEILIYVPAIANYQRSWLADRIAVAQVAALVLDAAPGGKVAEDVERHVLTRVGAHAITLHTGDTRGVLHLGRMPDVEVDTIDLRNASLLASVRSAWRTLTASSDRPLRIIGPGQDAVDLVEVQVRDAPLRAALVAFSARLLLSSLIIAAAAAGLVFVILQLFIARPVRRLARNIADFADNPERADRVIAPSKRTDEIGRAEAALARMEIMLSGELRQKRRLAELGLSVSKINHELRNLLTTAQLLGDRLESVADPVVQRVAPRLVGTLDRAIRFCEATLAYGRAAEQHPQRRVIRLERLLSELPDLAGLATSANVVVALRAAPDLKVDADPDQLARVLTNLVRNAVQALDASGASEEGEPTVTIEALRAGPQVTILVEDNGPGLPERARTHLFAPFQGSARAGGTGLGLAIAAELVELHGGTLSLDNAATGTRFRVVIPDRADEHAG